MPYTRRLPASFPALIAAGAFGLGAVLVGGPVTADTGEAPVSVEETDLAGDYDLRMLVTSEGVEPLKAGDTASFVISVENAGPATAPAGWTVTSSATAGLTAVGLAAAPDSLPYACALGVNDFNCIYSDELAAGASAPLGTFRGTVSEALADATSVDNTACVGDNPGDTDATNDCATAATPLMAADPVAEVAVQGVMLEGPAETAAPTAAAGELADTGSNGTSLLLPGAALVVLGLAAMRIGRSREGDLN
jgi:hypothetical protein